MKRAGFCLGTWLAALLLFGCTTADPGGGSNTNWLRPCDEDAECDSDLSCLCGVCTAPCDGACPDLPGAVCVAPGGASHGALCTAPGDADEVAGLCVPGCDGPAGCADGQLCHAGSCLQLAGADESSSGCSTGATLELSAGELELEARHGTLFGDALYLPVVYAERPADWVEPMTPQPILARVIAGDGAALEGCHVRFLTTEGSGSAFAERESSDALGEVTAFWVAGAARQQALTAAVVDQSGQVISESLLGIGYANDEGPQDESEAATDVTRPTTVRLGYDLPEAANLLRVRLAPTSFPHHAFYAALTTDGFFAGLQNTSDLDALREGVPEGERVLIASVWNLAGANAELLFQSEGLQCGSHDQDLGGIRCTRAAAWQPGGAYLFTLERGSLLSGAVGEGYAELGYATTPCASASGCTDYTLYFAAADEPDVMQRVVAYRYQSGELATHFGSFVQPYVELAGQTSCLLTPRYDASFLPYVGVDGAFQPVTQATFSATYRSWHNEICANYAASVLAEGFQLATGGPRILDRPSLPGDSARLLTLP